MHEEGVPRVQGPVQLTAQRRPAACALTAGDKHSRHAQRCVAIC